MTLLFVVNILIKTSSTPSKEVQLFHCPLHLQPKAPKTNITTADSTNFSMEIAVYKEMETSTNDGNITSAVSITMYVFYYYVNL